MVHPQKTNGQNQLLVDVDCAMEELLDFWAKSYDRNRICP